MTQHEKLKYGAVIAAVAAIVSVICSVIKEVTG